ncbi:VOC family protein [Gallaecimonas sp. GXIMD4217]|uniref:VOC family protein n=1 Tax=Gallaecimonas sp. GXIMD4217 TaxID=3131927 RepID=UPI00311AD55D
MLNALPGDLDAFLNRIFYLLAEADVCLLRRQVDHLCYHAESDRQYRRLKAELARDNKLLVEGLIGGRAIATFELAEPVTWHQLSIPLLELCAPKAGKASRVGYEHVEVVLSKDESLADFAARHAHLDLDCRHLHRARNAEVVLGFGTLRVKFHKESLAEVIEREIANGEVVPVPH